MTKEQQVAYVAIGVIIGIAILCIIYSISTSNSPTLSCREGKLFEVSHEGNITIYDPTFSDCEENK